MRPGVHEGVRIPRRSRLKKQQPPPPSLSPPPRQQEEEFEHARYDCAFQDEGEGGRDFAPPDLVWGNVRNHPWWPGQVFDTADVSELALRHRRAGATLVAYFGDRTFAWNDASALLPFRANFRRFSAQSTTPRFVSAVDHALQEVTRRVEAGLFCPCFGSAISTKQEVENAGVRQGAFGAVVDGAYIRDAFRGKTFLDYISALGKEPLAGVDPLDLATAKAQLRAFNRSRAPRGLPEFVVIEGIEDATDATPCTKRKRMHKGSENNDAISKKEKLRHAGSSSFRNETFPEAANEDVMDALSRGATDEDTVNKGNKSKQMKNSAKKKTDVSKNSEGIEEAVVGGSGTPDKDAVDDALSWHKSVRILRSTRRKEEQNALEGLKKLGKDGGSETVIGNCKDTPLLKRNKPRCRASAVRKKDKITEVGDGLRYGSARDSPSSSQIMLGCAEKSISKRVLISEHSRKKNKLPELMAGAGWLNSAPGCKNKTREMSSLYESAEKAEGPDTKGRVKIRKRKKLDTLGDLSPLSQSLSRKKSTKGGELMRKSSRFMPQTPPAAKANCTASRTKSRRARHNQESAANKSPLSVKLNQGKKDAFTEEPPSCSEMLRQLSLASCDHEQRVKIAPTILNFFTDFRKNSNVSSLDINEEIPDKAVNTESDPSEQPVADHMQDDYWADILINVEELLSSLKKKDAGQKRTSKEAQQVKKLSDNSLVTLENADKPRNADRQDTENGKHHKAESKPFVTNGSQLDIGSKHAEEMENSLLAGLVLHFNRPDAVPSCSDLIKIFSQYGPVKEAETEITNNVNSAKVIFKRRIDAEAAFGGTAKINALRPALDSFRLTDFPAAALRNVPSCSA